MGTKKKVVDAEREMVVTASMALKVIRDGAKRAGVPELYILRVITKLLYSGYDVLEIKQ